MAIAQHFGNCILCWFFNPPEDVQEFEKSVLKKGRESRSQDANVPANVDKNSPEDEASEPEESSIPRRKPVRNLKFWQEKSSNLPIRLRRGGVSWNSSMIRARTTDKFHPASYISCITYVFTPLYQAWTWTLVFVGTLEALCRLHGCNIRWAGTKALLFLVICGNIILEIQCSRECSIGNEL